MSESEVTGLMIMPPTVDPEAVAALLTLLSDLGFGVGEEVGGVVAVTGPVESVRALTDHVSAAAQDTPAPEANQTVLQHIRRAEATFAWDEGSELHP